MKVFTIHIFPEENRHFSEKLLKFYRHIMYLNFILKIIEIFWMHLFYYFK